MFLAFGELRLAWLDIIACIRDLVCIMSHFGLNQDVRNDNKHLSRLSYGPLTVNERTQWLPWALIVATSSVGFIMVYSIPQSNFPSLWVRATSQHANLRGRLHCSPKNCNLPLHARLSSTTMNDSKLVGSEVCVFQPLMNPW